MAGIGCELPLPCDMEARHASDSQAVSASALRSGLNICDQSFKVPGGSDCLA